MRDQANCPVLRPELVVKWLLGRGFLYSLRLPRSSLILLG